MRGGGIRFALAGLYAVFKFGPAVCARCRLGSAIDADAEPAAAVTARFSWLQSAVHMAAAAAAEAGLQPRKTQ